MKLYFVLNGEIKERELKDSIGEKAIENGYYHPTPAAAIQAEVERAYKKTLELKVAFQEAHREYVGLSLWADKKLAELGEKGENKSVN